MTIALGVRRSCAGSGGGPGNAAAFPKVRRRIALGAALAFGLASAVVLADPPAPAQPAQTDPEATPTLQSVVVTAQLRKENLQLVPVSADVVGGVTLAQQNLNDLAGLTQAMPDVHVGEDARSNDMYIRGIGSGVNPSFDQSVGIFEDGIYLGRSRDSEQQLLDLDRVEVLKGPQSTYFGNNAIAGAFNIVTVQPGDTPDFSARAFWGEYGQYTAQAAATVPLVQNVLSVRLAAIADGEGGWLHNINLGNNSPDDNNQAYRVSLRYTPTDDLEVTLKSEAGRNRNSGSLPFQYVNCPPPAPFTAAGFCATALANGEPTGLASHFTAASPQGTSLDTVQEVLRVDYHFGGQTLTSISGYYRYGYHFDLDIDDQPPDLYQVSLPESYNQESEELHLASALGGPIEYLVGVYAQVDHLDVDTNQVYGFATPAFAATPFAPYTPIAQRIAFDQNEQSYAAFGSLTWNLTSQLKITPGVRLSWVNKEYTGDLAYGTAASPYGDLINFAPVSIQQAISRALGAGSLYNLSLQRQDKATQPSLKVQYQMAPQVMGYLSYVRGFKSGGFNASDTTGNAAVIPFAPEHVDAYEAGIKSELLRRHLQVNLDGFLMSYSDLQVAYQQLLPSGSFEGVVNNAAAARSEGAELNLEWIVNPTLRFGIEGTYLDAYYEEYSNVSPTSLEIQELGKSAVQNLSGRPTEFSPHASGSANAVLSPRLPGGYSLSFEAIDRFSSGYFLTATDDPLARQNAYSRLDGRVALACPDGFTVSLIGQNLTNQVIRTFAAPLATSNGSFVEEQEMPRFWGVEVQYHYQ